MIDRYKIKNIEDIWSDESKINTWWTVELAILNAWSKIGVIPKQDIINISKSVEINIKRMIEIENETKHDVVAFTRMISEKLGHEKKWIHLGVTSTDIVDTAQNILIKKSFDLVNDSILKILNKLKSMAISNKDTIIMGRSHGIFGEPTSLGLKFLLWYEEIKRQHKRINDAKADVCVTKISGSMGNFANLELEIEEDVANKLDMPYDTLSTQVSQRDRLASMFTSFSNYASTIEKIATEIRLLHRTEVDELREGFTKNQKGSSSMPHKKNPISSENITGLSRLLKSYTIVALENNVLWHERDISHSSNERIIIPDAFHLIIYITNRLYSILNDLNINKQKMMENILSANNIFYSQPILTQILKKTNYSREEIYDFIQKCSIESLEQKKDFIKVLIENKIDKYIQIKELESICNLKYFTRNIEKIYKRIK